MFARKPYTGDTLKKAKIKEPAWHNIEQKNIYKGTTKIDTLCGPVFPVDGITEIVDKIPNGGRRCGTCRNLSDGKDSMRRWANTGLSTKQI